MSSPTDPPEEEDRLRPGMPTITGGSAAASSGGRAAAAAVGASVEAAGRRMVTRKVVLYRNPVCKSFGVQLKSPGEKEQTNSIGCLIKAVLPSCSASEGAILPEDQLLSINGKLVLDWPYHEIVSCINELASDTLMMLIRRELPNPTKAASVSNAAASSAGGGVTGAGGAAAATGTAGVPDGDPQLDQAGSTAPAAAVASSPDRGTRRRNPGQGTVSYQEQFQAPSPSPRRGSREDWWKNNFEELRKYKIKHGHCDVPQKYPSNPALSHFVHYVRAKRNVLSKERREMLAELDFVFNTHEAAWEDKFHDVQEYFGEAGCTGISMSALRSEEPRLYEWIRKQRAAYARLRRGDVSAMAEDKISRLEEIGIDLDPSGKFVEGGGGGSRRESRKKKVCIHIVSFRRCFPRYIHILIVYLNASMHDMHTHAVRFISPFLCFLPFYFILFHP